MKLQNKKTGGLATLVENEDCLTLKTDAGFHHYLSLAELNEDWEDYEEPKKYYYITSCGEITHRGYRLWENESVYDKKRKQIGNYFETEAEAEKAVEKLKAWKRLKDKGFEFKYIENNHIEFGSGYIDDVDQFTNDMTLLFGGEE